MRTNNPDIDIFYSEKLARAAFNKLTVPCDLLYAKKYGKTWYVDKAKTALKAWPDLYELIETK